MVGGSNTPRTVDTFALPRTLILTLCACPLAIILSAHDQQGVSVQPCPTAADVDKFGQDLVAHSLRLEGVVSSIEQGALRFIAEDEFRIAPRVFHSPLKHVCG